MKIITALMLLLTITTSAWAQTTPLDEQIAMVRENAHADRKGLIMGNMHFTAEESDLFWPAWNAYRAEMAEQGDRRLALIRNFAQHYEDMTEQKANELMTDAFSIQMQDVVIKQSFARKLGGFLPAPKVLRIIQIESKIDAAIDMQLAAEIPLAK